MLSGATAFSQTIPPEERQRLIANLDSADFGMRSRAVDSIARFGITEALPALEQKIWRESTVLKFSYLDALLSLNSTNLETIARAIIDSADIYSARVAEMYDPYEIRAEASYYLFRWRDYSTAEYLFDRIQRRPTDTDGHTLDMLKDLAQNVPAYAQRAKTELIRLSHNASLDFERWRAADYIVELYGTEMFPELVEIVRHDPTTRSVNRLSALEHLYQLGYPEMHSLLQERLSLEPASPYRVFIAESLLVRFGTLSDYRLVQNHLLQEPNNTARSLMARRLQGFIPPRPRVDTSVLTMLDTLRAQLFELSTLGWIGDTSFVNETDGLLGIARAHLTNLDSLNCMQQANLFQQKVDEEYRDSLDGDNRFVTIEGWKFLYYNAQYILDRLPAPPTLSIYSLFATHSMWLEQNATVYSGDIGVNAAGSPPFLDSQVELSVGIGSTTAAGLAVKAHRIKVKQGATLTGDVYYNELDNNGTITGVQHTPLTLPLTASLPEFKSSTPGTQNIVVPQNGSQTVPPGSYGDIDIRKNGTLTFTGGEYHVASLTGGDDVRLVFQAPANVRIAGRFDSGQGDSIGPEDTTTVTADQIMFYVGGVNGTNGTLGGTPKAAKIGINNRVRASFYVPNGTLWIRQNSEAKGAFIGKDVDVGIGVKIWR